MLNSRIFNINMFACTQFKSSETKFCCSFFQKSVICWVVTKFFAFACIAKGFTIAFSNMLTTEYRWWGLSVFIVLGVFLLFARLQLLETFYSALSRFPFPITSFISAPTLREKCPYSEFLWPVFSRIRTRKTPNTGSLHAVQVFRFFHFKQRVRANINFPNKVFFFSVTTKYIQ